MVERIEAAGPAGPGTSGQKSPHHLHWDIQDLNKIDLYPLVNIQKTMKNHHIYINGLLNICIYSIYIYTYIIYRLLICNPASTPNQNCWFLCLESRKKKRESNAMT